MKEEFAQITVSFAEPVLLITSENWFVLFNELLKTIIDDFYHIILLRIQAKL